MLVNVEIGHTFIFTKFNVLFQGKESCTDKIYASKPPRSVSLRGVRLRTVLVIFCIFENLILWLRAVLVTAETLISRKLFLACLSWAQVGSIQGETIAKKSRDTATLRRQI